MSRSILESLKLFKLALEDSVAALREKEVQDVPDKLKLSELAPWIDLVGGEPEPVPGKHGGTILELSSSLEGVKHIIFTDQTAEVETTPWGSEGVVKWTDSETLYVSTQTPKSKVIMPEACNGMFTGKETLESIDFKGADFAETTSLSNAFQNCIALTEIDLSEQTMPVLTNLNEAFRGCSALTTLNFTKSKLTALTNMGGTFRECPLLTELDLSGFDTSKVTTMYRLFNGSSTLSKLDLSTWKTPLVTNMNGAFLSCTGLQEVDLSNFEIGAVTDMVVMFSGCSSLSTIYATEWDSTKNEALDSGNMFANCPQLPNFNAGGTIAKAKWKENGGYFTNPAQKINIRRWYAEL